MMDYKEKNHLSYVMYILAMLIFGSNGYFASHITISSTQIVLLRTLIGGFLLTLLVMMRGGFDRQSVKQDRYMLLFGGAALGFNWVALFGAYRALNVSLATLIYYLGPMIVLLLSPLLFHERLTAVKLMSIVVVAVGLVCISGSILLGHMSITGMMMAVASALLYALLLVFNKRITHTDGMQTAAIELDIACLVVLFYTLMSVGMPHMTAGDIPYIVIIGLMNTGLAYFLYFTGLQKLPGQTVALLSYIDPVSALCFSVVLLHENMTVMQMIGALLMLGGAMLGECKAKKQADNVS